MAVVNRTNQTHFQPCIPEVLERRPKQPSCSIILYVDKPPQYKREQVPKEFVLENFPQNIRYEDTTNRVGNEDGFNMFAQFDEMRAELAEMKKSMRETEERTIRAEEAVNKKIYYQRLSVFEERRVWWWHRGGKLKSITQPRNASVHGGDIEADLYTIREAESEGLKHVGAYKYCFRQAYGIEVGPALTAIKSSPQRLVKAFDILASVRELKSWSGEEASEKAKEKAGKIEGLAMKVINETFGVDDLEQRRKLLAEGGLLEAEYREMVKLFGNGHPDGEN